MCACVRAKSLLSLFNPMTLFNPMDCSPPGSSDHGDSSGKNSGVGCHAFLQGIFLTQRLSLSLKSPALAGGFFNTSATWEDQLISCEQLAVSRLDMCLLKKKKKKNTQKESQSSVLFSSLPW